MSDVRIRWPSLILVCFFPTEWKYCQINFPFSWIRWLSGFSWVFTASVRFRVIDIRWKATVICRLERRASVCFVRSAWLLPRAPSSHRSTSSWLKQSSPVRMLKHNKHCNSSVLWMDIVTVTNGCCVTSRSTWGRGRTRTLCCRVSDVC